MFAPGKVEVQVDGRVKESVRFGDSHEAEDAARRFAQDFPRGVVLVTYDGMQPEIWEDFI